MFWKLYNSNEEAWEAMLDACTNAKKSIDLEQYIFIPDEVGRRFIDICAKKSSEGVRVRFLWDGAGSFTLLGNFLISVLSRRGVQVAFFNTFLPRALHNHSWWFFRNHRRSLVIDGKKAFTGSICMWKKTIAWRDTHLLLEGPIVADIAEKFQIMWDRAHGIKADWGNDISKAKNRVIHSENPEEDLQFRYITNTPVRGKHYMYEELISAIRNAHKYIYLTTPYFVPDRRLLRVLRLAKRRGVDVRIILPKSSDYPVVDLAGQTFYTKVLKSGIRIYRYSNEFIHAKTGVIDGTWSTVGTMNLDNVSLLYNFEANVVSTNTDFCGDVETIFTRDLSLSEELLLADWEKRHFTRKTLEFFVRFIRKIL